jgi:hypothetical protein
VLAVVAWTVWQLDPFGPSFASMDHPFHVSRAETLRRSLADGESLRWIAHHQGGYPVEFYPLGIAYLVAGLALATAGAIPIAAAHKLVVIAIFLSPVAAYAWYARRDALPPIVVLTAAVLHLL